MEAAKVPVIYWPKKGDDATRICRKLSTGLGHMLLTYSTITNWLRKPEQGDDITRPASGSHRLPNDHIDALITSILEQCPFHSVRACYCAIQRQHAIVWQYLHSARFVVRNLRPVSHQFSPSKKAERIGMAIELQEVRQSAKHHVGQYF
jgi:hypothetical protein